MEYDMIYFAATEDEKYVKIGYCKNDPIGRISDLQVGCPLKIELLGTMEGTRHYESKLHRRFRSHIVNGEWFTLDTDLKEFIEENALPIYCIPAYKPAYISISGNTMGISSIDRYDDEAEDTYELLPINVIESDDEITPELNEWVSKMRILIDGMRNAV